MKTKQIIIGIALLISGILVGKYVLGNNTSEITNTHQNKTKEQHWMCSMHPQIDMPTFGSCPICGMDLILKEAANNKNLSKNSFKMSKNAMALANIETTIVGESETDDNSNKTLKLSGKIMVNNNVSAIQTAHFGGRIEKLYFKSKGSFVKKGTLIASIYSPQLVTTQNELIEALNVKEIQPELYKAVRNKLKLWKISEKQIQQIEHSKKVVTNFNIYANVSGSIEQFFSDEGNHVKEGAPLFKVSNLSSVWAVFDVYEQDIKNLKLGQIVTVKLNAYPDKKIKATINFIAPNLNTNTRTVSVRATLINTKNSLKPGMLLIGIVDLKGVLISKSDFISVPKTAVMWTGKRSIVYVKIDKNNSIFELREVKLGASVGENYQILSGLSNGEEVVTNGAFTVDATAQLQGKNSMMSPKKEDKSKGISEKRIKKIVVNKKFVYQLNNVFQNYISLKNGLVLTDAKKVNRTAKTTLISLQKVQMKLLKNPEAHTIWMNHKKEIKNALEIIKKENDVEKQRTVFIELSNSMIVLANTFGVHATIYVQHCPMANNNKGADWLSYDEKIKNPYFGDKMLSCGDIKQIIKSSL